MNAITAMQFLYQHRFGWSGQVNQTSPAGHISDNNTVHT